MTTTAITIADLAAELGADPADVAATAHQLADIDGGDVIYTGDVEAGPRIVVNGHITSAGTVLTASAADQIRGNWAEISGEPDLTDATITAAFDDAATIDGYIVTIDLGVTIDPDDGPDAIERVVVEQLTSGRPVLFDHATNLYDGDDSRSNPHLFLNQASLAAGRDGVVVGASAWAADWDGESFRNERSGRAVLIVVPVTVA
jgi:hypothetical protein